jgi:hypothetical protein
MINSRDVDPQFAHLGKVAPRLLRGSEVVTGCVRSKRPVGDPLHEKLLAALEEELGESSDANRRSLTHEEPSLVQGAVGRKAFAERSA